MPRDAEWITNRTLELRDAYGLLTAKQIAEEEHKLNRLAALRVSANLKDDHELIELIDIVRELVDGR